MLTTEGSKKAATLLMLLGKEKAEQLLQGFNENEIAKISRAMSSITNLSKSAAKSVMNDYLARVEELALPGDGMMFGASFLQPKEQDGLKVEALDMLSKLPANKVAEILEHEHEQVIAVILAYFSAELAAACLLEFPEAIRNDLVLRISSLTNLQPQLLEEINSSLDSVVNNASSNDTAFSGAERMADIIMNMPRSAEKAVMNSLDSSPEMKAKVGQYFLSFEQCTQYSSREMLIILKDFDRERLAMACAKESVELVACFINSMSTRAQAAFKEELVMIEVSSTQEAIEMAQRELISHVKKLIHSGELSAPSK